MCLGHAVPQSTGFHCPASLSSTRSPSCSHPDPWSSRGLPSFASPRMSRNGWGQGVSPGGRLGRSDARVRARRGVFPRLGSPPVLSLNAGPVWGCPLPLRLLKGVRRRPRFRSVSEPPWTSCAAFCVTRVLNPLGSMPRSVSWVPSVGRVL